MLGDTHNTIIINKCWSGLCFINKSNSRPNISWYYKPLQIYFTSAVPKITYCFIILYFHETDLKFNKFFISYFLVQAYIYIIFFMKDDYDYRRVLPFSIARSRWYPLSKPWVRELAVSLYNSFKRACRFLCTSIYFGLFCFLHCAKKWVGNTTRTGWRVNRRGWLTVNNVGPTALSPT